MQTPKLSHYKEAKRVLRYIRGTSEEQVTTQVAETKLVGFLDSDRGGCKEDMKSTSGYCFSLGSGGKLKNKEQ
uniref:Reverse transcriptase Ty1/copia-type domain-containing protein n=1 Tax=Brassica oleracea TaxID=3712 RepID=A0A3P6D5B6_BRAOL|nr:unnamed protein product [Brassica oleracea]